jgi:hypothetical protein
VSADDRQVGGDHYKKMALQPWTVMELLLTREEFIGFMKGSILKYSLRAGRKDGTDDEAKAAHYFQKLNEILGD